MTRNWIAAAFTSGLFLATSAALVGQPASSAKATWKPDPSDPSGKSDPLAYWTQWRGPSGQGYSADTRAPLKWSETENIAWKTKLPGAGNSTPVVHGDRVFLTAAGAKGKELYVLCVSAADGKILWQQTAAQVARPDASHAWNGHASPSCATDGRYVYAFFGTPGLFCYDLDGKLIWQKQFGVFTSETGWGVGASPFLYGDLVIQNCDNDGPKALPKDRKPGDEAAPMRLVALEKKTGKVVWTAERDQGRGFSTPRLMRVADGRVDLVLNGPLGVVGYDPSNGKQLWQCLRSAANDQQRFGEPMPVNDGSALFVLSGRPGPCQAIRLPGTGDVTKSHVVWQGSRKSHRDVASPILWENNVYVADNKGALSCYHLKTGKELFNERIGRGTGKALASPVALRGKLLFLLDDGLTVVIEPGDKLAVVGENRLGEGVPLDFGASPAVADGKLFLRSQTHLYCISEKK